MGARDIALKAKSELQDITGLRAETVSKIAAQDNGWQVDVDMVELKSIPESKDVIATYELLMDGDGNTLSYKRVRRFLRGETT